MSDHTSWISNFFQEIKQIQMFVIIGAVPGVYCGLLSIRLIDFPCLIIWIYISNFILFFRDERLMLVSEVAKLIFHLTDSEVISNNESLIHESSNSHISTTDKSLQLNTNKSDFKLVWLLKLSFFNDRNYVCSFDQ